MRRHETPLPRVNPSGRKVWVARYTGRDGKRRSAGTFDLKREAQAAIDAAYDNEPTPGGAKTVGEYAASWTRRRPRSARTDDTNDRRLAALLGPVTPEQVERAAARKKSWKGVKVGGRLLRDWPLRELRRREAMDLVDILLRDQGRAALGAKGILLAFSAMYTDAIDEGDAETNPFSNVKVRAGDPRVQKAPRAARVLTWAQMHALCAAAGEDAPMLRVLADCGLRLGELLALQRADVKLGGCDECDVAVSHFHVRRSAHHGVVTVGTKRERLRQSLEGGRVVVIPPALEEMLRAMPRRIDTQLLFPTVRGAVFWEANFRMHVWNPARRASGIEATPQDFRHSWVSNLRASRIDPADLADMAGHSELVASQVYTHSMRRSFEAVAAAVGG